MYSFSKKSLMRLHSCHPDLQRLFNEVINNYDCTVICGHRNEEDQNEAVREGKSKLKWPHSKHNSLPSMAVDVAPYPIDWHDTSRFYHFAGFVMATSLRLNIKIRWGGDWGGNLNFRDEKFKDLPHFEIDV